MIGYVVCLLVQFMRRLRMRRKRRQLPAGERWARKGFGSENRLKKALRTGSTIERSLSVCHQTLYKEEYYCIQI